MLLPEWTRLRIAPIGKTGFCALRLAQCLLDQVPAGNCKLQTLRQYYRLPERGAHTALWESLELEIVRVIESTNRLRESAEYELAQLAERQPGLIDAVAAKRIAALDAEVAELKTEVV